MEEKFEKIDAAIYHLIFIGNSIVNHFKSFSRIIGKVDDRDETILYAAMFSSVLLQTTSFMEEYNKFVDSDEEELKQVIIALKKTVKPAVRSINRWSGLGDFRNHVLAHNFRVKKTGHNSVFIIGFESYKIPQSSADLHVLMSSVEMIKDVFESAFKQKLTAFRQYLDAQPKAKGEILFSNMKQVELEVESIKDEINSGIKTLKELL